MPLFLSRRLSSAPAPELLILALAALTRFWRLGFHSFWFDEIVSLDWASHPPAEIWEIGFALVREKHPPGYYLTLHFWQSLLAPFGLEQSDVALRALGSGLGALTVLGVLLLATRLSGRAVGLLAGTLTALSPALVWYSQELRMFQPAATAIVWAVYWLVCAAGVQREVRGEGEKGRREEGKVAPTGRRLLCWAGMVLALTYALYSYLFAAFFLPGLGLSLLLLTRRRRRLLAEGSAALAATALLFLPLARNAWLINDSESPRMAAFDGFADNLWRQVQVFTVWRAAWPGWAVTAAIALFALLIVAGLLLQRREKGAPVGALLAMWTLPPLVIAGLLQATNANIFKEDRYYIFLTPFALWAAARTLKALAARWGRVGWVGAAIAAGLLAGSLPVLWSPGMLREEWRAAAAYVADYQENAPGLSAGGVAHVNYLQPAVDWYLGQRIGPEQLPVFGLFGGPLTPDQMETVIGPPLHGIETALGAHTLWLWQSHLDGVDDERLVERWLNENYPTITEQYPPGIKLSGYALRTRYEALPPLSPRAVYPGAALAPAIELSACEVVTPQVAAQDLRLHPPSGWVHIRLWLRATGPVAKNHTLSARVVGGDGVWGEVLSRPNSGLERFPTSTWQPDGWMRIEADINLNPQTPPGLYTVVVGLTEGAEAECGPVEIVSGP